MRSIGIGEMTITGMHADSKCVRNVLAVFIAGWCLCVASRLSAGEPAELAARIDALLEERLEQEQITPAPPADDAEFLRRVHLDLIGCPPTPDVVRQFLSDSDPDKRARLIDALLADPRHADHFAMTWRALLLPEADSDPQIRYFQPGLEAWLRQRRSEGAGFDAVVRELLSAPIASPSETPQLVLRDLKSPNPLAFIASKGGDPANIAASATRLFLGVRLECAQCHDHPFDPWTQTQFWNQAAFFSGIERRGSSPFAPLVEAGDRHEISVMETEDVAPAVFLNGVTPPLVDEMGARTALADWMTSPDNPWFSRAIVNRIWGQLLGEGFVQPVDDFGQGNPASHPKLLGELAASFAESGFDLTFLQAAICRTDAYQRTSRLTDAGQEQLQGFAKMAIKPMSGEQFFATLSQSIGHARQLNRLGAGRDEDPVRRRVLSQFASSGLYADPETSVSQALLLMNGDLVNDATAADAASMVGRMLSSKGESTEQQVEHLYLLTLARFPTSEERRELVAHVDDGEVSARARRFGDVLWVLLNTAEFRWNH